MKKNDMISWEHLGQISPGPSTPLPSALCDFPLMSPPFLDGGGGMKRRDKDNEDGCFRFLFVYVSKFTLRLKGLWTVVRIFILFYFVIV